MTYVFRSLHHEHWAQALARLNAACLTRDVAATGDAYADLYAALAEAGHADLFAAAAAGLRFAASPLAEAAVTGTPPAGLLAGARHDLEALLALLRRDLHAEAADITGAALPPLADLGNGVSAAPSLETTQALEQLLRTAEVKVVLAALLESYREHGSGDLARYPAFRWVGGALRGVSHPAWPDAARLVGVGGPVARLQRNTEAFLAGRPAQHALLYGPRGSGKSTALRSLGGCYAEAGLRLVEVAPDGLGALPDVLELLRGRPHRYLIFTDDLSFGAGSSAYGPLKSLLEGSLTARPDNVLVYATSNRRHLVPERFADRPDPLEREVHAWDTQHERLALADRFGLVITFPDATQRRYLEIVRGLAERDGVEDEGLEERAVRFAEWGNGYSGRTAEQFVRALKGGLI